MPPPLTIAMTACDRPWCLRRVLASLAACEGIADCLLLPRVEPGCEEVTAILAAFTACECRPVINPAKLLCNRNTVAAIDAGLEAGGGVVVYVDDDTPLAPDALDYFRWADDRYRGEPSVFSVAAYGPRGREQDIPPEADWHRVERDRWFHAQGFLVWGDRWAGVRPSLEGKIDPTWDTIVNAHVIASDLREIRPVLSRAQNVGRHTSRAPNVTRADLELYDRTIKLRHWANDVEVPAGAFYEGRSAR